MTKKPIEPADAMTQSKDPRWRPMSEFDPARPGILHDRLNGKVIAWEPERFLESFQKHAHPFEPGVIEWDGLLLDSWRLPSNEGKAWSEGMDEAMDEAMDKKTGD